MHTITTILSSIEKGIKKSDERGYFWTHSVRYQYILERVSEIAKDRKLTILDIGCFPYHVGKALEIMGHTVYGIASSHEPVDNKNIKILNIESDTFPFKDNFFDLVLCNEVIEHLPQTPIIPMREIYRVTKKNGLCMITTPNIARSINRGKLLLGMSIMYPTSVYYENNGKGNNIYHRHNREYTLQELGDVVKNNNWKLDTKEYFISYTPFRKRQVPDNTIVFLGKFLNYLSMLLLPQLQDTLLVLGRKI